MRQQQSFRGFIFILLMLILLAFAMRLPYAGASDKITSQEFVRIRVGVGKKPDHMDLADYVLSRFGKEDLANIRESCGNACDAVETILSDGAVAAMNKFN